MKYYLYRIKYKVYTTFTQTDIIKNTLDKLELEHGDKVIILVSQSLVVMGAYRYNKESDRFVREKEINKSVEKFYDKLPMVEFVNENTYRMFSKRLREIDKENYDAFLK